LLKREKRGHAFVYSAASSRNEFIGNLVRSVTRDFVPPGEDDVLAAFVSRAAELDESQLAALEESIRQYESRRADITGPSEADHD
jgi:predicted transcriptional regulator